MKTLICAAVLASLPLQAEELQFDLIGQAYTSDGTALVGPVSISFMLDSASGTPFFNNPAPGHPSSPCVQNSGVSGAAFTNVSVTMNGQSIWTASTASSSYGISNINGNCPVDRFFTTIGFGDFSPTVDWEFTPGPGTQDEYLATGNSAIIFTGSQSFQPYGLLFTGMDESLQEYSVNFDSIHIAAVPVDVPEPSTLTLLLLGLASLLFLRKWRRARN